jgi:uncharacterized protein with von Willebrand factor type A (vWA) domain
MKSEDLSHNDGRYFRSVSTLPIKPVHKIGWHLRHLGRYVDVDVSKNVLNTEATNDLIGDLFMHLYVNPDMVKREHAPPGREINHALMEWAKEKMDPWRSMYSIPSAKAATYAAASVLLSDGAIQDALKKQEEAEEKRKEAAQENLTAAGKRATGDSTGAANAKNKSDELSDEAKELIAQALAKIDGKKGDDEKAVKSVMQEASEEANEEANEAFARQKMWGLGDGNISDHDGQAIMEKARYGKLRRISDLVGRLKGVALGGIQEKEVGLPHVALTKDVTRLLPTEIAMLSPRAPMQIRAQKWRDLTQRGLLGWKDRASGRKAGAFFAYVDVSGSMRGDPVIAAKSLALGLALAAKESGHAQKWMSADFDTRVNTAITDESTPKQMTQYATRFASGGGTEFSPIVRDAIQRIGKLARTDPKTLDTVDILFITDGQSGIDVGLQREFNSLRRQYGIRTMLLLIEDYDYKTSLEDVCDIKVRFPPAMTKEEVETAVEQFAEAMAEYRPKMD